MKTQKTATGKRPPRRAWYAVALGATLVLAGVAGGVVYWLKFRVPPPPDVKTQPPEVVTKYMASVEFAKLPEDQRIGYVRSAREAREQSGAPRPATTDLTPEEQERLRNSMGAVFRKQMDDQVKGYFALPPDQRGAYLDNLLEQAAERRSQWTQRSDGAAPGGPGARGPNRQAPDPERMKAHMEERLETTDPLSRAQAVAFRQAMQQRAKERGIQMGRGPGR
jgi:hypothetical protein